MPELPEVETVCKGLQTPLTGANIKKIIIRVPALRWPIPQALTTILVNNRVERVSRRAKYILLHTAQGNLIIHLGMSGVLRLHNTLPTPKKHDHVDFLFDRINLRYTDPRRFGAILWHNGEELNTHPLFAALGPEPLSHAFTPTYLEKALQRRKGAIKSCVMDQKIVVGVGNIYANEALFTSRLHPERQACALTKKEIARLCQAIKTTLDKAIRAGGTTLKDFQSSEGKPGYFTQKLQVYGREDQPCLYCNTRLKKISISQRATVFCPTCQLFQ